MGPPDRARGLIVNADDFGFSSSINQAVALAHQQGVLTSASLMTGGAAFAEAVEIARQNPSLGTGLHLTLVCGQPTLPSERSKGLVVNGSLRSRPVSAGMAYQFKSSLRPQIEQELEAQFEKFFSTGLPLDHVNGHLHFHLHPAVLKIIIRNRDRWKIRGFRITRDPFLLNLKLARGRVIYRWTHSMIYHLLAAFARRRWSPGTVVSPQWTFGLLQDSRVNEAFLLRLIENLPAGISEIYSHPSMDRFKFELEALTSPRVKEAIHQRGINLLRYQDL